MAKLNLTKDEADLIEAIRNLRKSFPNGYAEQLWYIQQLVDKLTDLPEET